MHHSASALQAGPGRTITIPPPILCHSNYVGYHGSTTGSGTQLHGDHVDENYGVGLGGNEHYGIGEDFSGAANKQLLQLFMVQGGGAATTSSKDDAYFSFSPQKLLPYADPAVEPLSRLVEGLSLESSPKVVHHLESIEQILPT
ncbi:unnamed protein product, partial [Amoebophrya sp. A25]|eukprot:GSA25T00001304001.1